MGPLNGKTFYPYAKTFRRNPCTNEPPYVRIKTTPNTTTSSSSSSSSKNSNNETQFQKVPCMKLRDLYRKSVLRHWDLGKSLVIASEGLDYVADIGHVSVATIGSFDFSLASVLHETNDLSRLRIGGYTGAKTIDSLYHAKLFLNAGVPVTLLDISGVVADSNLDLTHVVACSVMNVPCTTLNTTNGAQRVEGIVQATETRNVKSGKEGKDGNYELGAISLDQRLKLEEILQSRDCQFQDLSNHVNLTLLYPKDVVQTWKHCKTNNQMGVSRAIMIQQMKNVLLEIE